MASIKDELIDNSENGVKKIQELTKEIEAISSSDDIQKLNKNDFLEVYDANDFFDASIENPTLTQILVVPTKKFDTVLNSLKDVPDFDTVYSSDFSDMGFGYFAASNSLDADINAVNGNKLSYYDVNNFKISPDIDIHNEDLKKFITSLCDLALKVRNLYIQENYQIQDIDSIDANAVSNNLIRKAKFFPETKDELKALCDDLTIYLGDIDTSKITDFSELFWDSKRSNEQFAGIKKWDTSHVTNMASMFRFAKNFNQDISSWDVSKVKSMSFMFFCAEEFNQALDSWDVSNITHMEGMFCGAYNFNQPLDNWDVSKVIDMSWMFAKAKNFNQALNNWDVSSVENMSSMFAVAENFNQSLDNWDVSNVTHMEGMFWGTSNFDQSLNNWDVSKVVNMSCMFIDSAFNQNISAWDVSKVDFMDSMFKNSKFNQPLDSWDVSKSISMVKMFENSDFQQDISSWQFNDTVSLDDFVKGIDYKALNLSEKILKRSGIEIEAQTDKNVDEFSNQSSSKIELQKQEKGLSL